jgi:hypothetical protein
MPERHYPLLGTPSTKARSRFGAHGRKPSNRTPDRTLALLTSYGLELVLGFPCSGERAARISLASAISSSSTLRSAGFEALKSLDNFCADVIYEWGTMSSLPVNVAVFFGKVDKRPSGWYWTPISEGHIPNPGSIAGPFETKAAAVEDAHQAAMAGHGGGID